MVYINALQQPVHYDPSVYKAAKEGELTKIQEFIDRGGWIDMPTSKGKSMLYYAAKKGHVKVVQYLLGQEAHSYRNEKNQTVCDKASSDVKQCLNGIKQESLDNLIDAKAKQYQPPQEAFAFITSIPLPQSKFKALESYAQEMAFSDPGAVILNIIQLQGITKTRMVEILVETALSCGDIQSACTFLDKLPRSDYAHPLLSAQIDLFKKDFAEAEGIVEKEQKRDPTAFKQLISASLNNLNISHKYSQQKVDAIIEQLSKGGSFASALASANQIKDPHLRGFARRGLSNCGLENFARKAQKKAKLQIDEEFTILEGMTQGPIDTAYKNGDFTAVLKLLKTIKNLAFIHSAYMSIAVTMCKLGKYEEAYKLVKIEFDNRITSQIYEEKLAKIIDMLVDKSEWLEKFSELKLK